ncbi:MAG: T9SS type B sorting domain-containing protein, partial [Bacteroidetes bacterium]|nr:T9SS type B sorting domain-containing protein [Bacteroidota bacterium]
WGNSSTNAAITVSPTTTTQYGVVYNYIGCYVQANALVVVNPIPTLSISDEIICEGESATLVPSGLQPTGGTFLWSTNSSEQTITVSPSVTSNYFVTYTANGCSSTPANATITVNPIPSLVINNAAICSGQSAILTAVPTILGGSIVWSPTNATTTSINVSPTVNTTYSAIYTLNNCSSESVSAEVTVNTIPQISFNASVLEGCSPLSIEFWNTSPDANLSTFTEWEIDNSTNFSGDTINPILDAGCHDITLSMTINGCTGSVTYNDFVCAESVPVASFISSTSSFSEISQSIDLINQSTGASNYIWNMGDGIFYETINVSHLFNQNTNGQTIWLTAISDLGCVDSTSLTILYEDPLIYYVPNSFTPDNDEYNSVFFPIITSGVDISSFEMTIFNRWGEVIFFTKNPYEGWDGSYGNLGLDTPPGVYTFIIKFKMPEKFDIQTIKGHINLLR